MDQMQEIKLLLDMTNQEDRNILKAIKSFAERHGISDDSKALRAWIIYMHFVGCDEEALNDKVKQRLNIQAQCN